MADKNHAKGKTKHSVKQVLEDVVSFGPESPTQEDSQIRLKRILRKLEELSRRIDYLASHQ